MTLAQIEPLIGGTWERDGERRTLVSATVSVRWVGVVWRIDGRFVRFKDGTLAKAGEWIAGAIESTGP